MLHPALNNNRAVVFDPCVTTGAKLLNEIGNVASDLLGLAHGAPRGDGIKLIRAPMGETFQMLDEVGARFDLIVSEPPMGTVPSAGIPKSSKIGDDAAAAKPVGRKLVMLSAAPAEAPAVPQIDTGLATWLVTNALLSPFGEALLIVSKASWELIQKESTYQRCWCVVQTTMGPVHLYVARDHRPAIPGTKPKILQQNEGELPDRSWIRGTTFSGLTPSADSRKFYTVREEIVRRSTPEFSEHNIRLDNNLIRLKFSEYQVATGAIPRNLLEEAETLRNKSLIDLALMRDTRDTTLRILKDKRLQVAPGLVAAFEDICRQMATLTAPFTRPSPVQRVAWLDEQGEIECTRNFGPFVAGQKYRLSTKVITGRKLEKRHRPGHATPEEILVTGQEVLVEVIEQSGGVQGYCHAFTQFPITKQMEDEWNNYGRFADKTHTLTDLIVNFKMPEVLDVAESDPATYLANRAKLEALQTTP